MSDLDVTSLLFAGPGEIRALCRAVNWSATPLGPVESWPVSLRVTVRNLLASRHPMVLFWGPELVQFYNDAFRPSLGEDGRHLVGLGARAADFWSEIWETTTRPQIDQVLSGGEAIWHADLCIPILRNGRMEDVYWTYGYSATHDDDGKIVGVLVVCLETTGQVTLRRELELERSRLAYVFQQSPSFVAVTRGPPYVFEFVNDAYRQMIGAHKELVGHLVFDVVPEARGQGFEALLDGVVETGEPFIGKETPIRLQRAPGAELELRYLNFVYFPLIEADGSRSGVIVHGVDITDQVQQRHEVERLLGESERARRDADAARADADEANKSKGEFLAMLSHELRTPLAAISGYSELLAMGVHGALAPEQEHYVHRIQRSQQHVLGLIDGLLSYAQVEAGKARYQLESVSIHEIVNECESLTAPQMQARKLSFTADCGSPDAMVLVDVEKTRQIVVNLISNAIKFTPPGGTITLECGVVDATTARVRVSDTGVGIAREDLKRIFEPFVRIDPTRSLERTGTGLGLAISMNFARGMGGTLTAESEVGVGSTFTLTLPRA